MNKKNILLRGIVLAILILLLGQTIFPSVNAEKNEKTRLKIFSDDVTQLIQTLEKEYFDIVGINRDEGFVEIITSDLETIESLGYNYKIINKNSRSVPPGYRDYEEILDFLIDIATTYPDITEIIDVGDMYGTGTTYERRNLYALKISDNADVDEDEPNVYIVSNHHAREITTPEYAIWAIEKLTSQYGWVEDVTRWVDHNQIYIAPTWNPDGLEHCFNSDPWWRKNRQPVGSGYYGVDLNRNFDFNWYGPYSGSTWPGSDTYKGPYPESEKETQAEVAFAEERHFAKVLDFHSYGSEVVYTYYLGSSFPSTVENYYRDKAEEMSYAFNYGGSYRKASAEGEHYQWELCDIGGFSYLVETGYDFQPSYSTCQSEFNDHIWPGIQWFLDHEIPLRGHVTEAVTGNPIEADIDIQGISYTQGEIRKSEPKFGRFHYFLPPGTYQITFSADGYDPKTVSVDIVEDESTLLEVQLGNGPCLTVNGIASPDNVLDLDFDWADGAGQSFMNGISLIDTGWSFKNGVFVPIGWDFVYQITVGAYPGWYSTLDGSGHASAILPIPDDPDVVGLTVFMAYFTFENKFPTAASAPVKIFIER